MKQYQIIKVYNVLEDLAKLKDYHEDEQWALYNLRKQLRVHSDFQREREEAIKNKYSPYADKDGMLKGEKYIEFVAELEALNNMDINTEYQKIALPLVDGINFLTIETLEDFIEFKH